MEKIKLNDFSEILELSFKNKKGKTYKTFCVVDTFSNTFQRIPNGEVEYYKYKTSLIK